MKNDERDRKKKIIAVKPKSADDYIRRPNNLDYIGSLHTRLD